MVPMCDGFVLLPVKSHEETVTDVLNLLMVTLVMTLGNQPGNRLMHLVMPGNHQTLMHWQGSVIVQSTIGKVMC